MEQEIFDFNYKEENIDKQKRGTAKETEENNSEQVAQTEEVTAQKEILDSLFKKNNISYRDKNYTIEWLVDRLGNGKFSMPKYQRKYVWNENQVIALVASILKKLPIPKLYGYYTESEDENQTTLVIDGQQRLTSLFMYYWGIFPRNNNKRISYGDKLVEITKLCKDYYENKNQNAKRELEKTYKLKVDYKFIYKSNDISDKQVEINLSYRHPESKLSPQEKFRFMDRELEFLIVEGNNYSDAVELFRLYNGGGTPLEAQEIRNGIYQNLKLYKKINEYSDNILLNTKKNNNEEIVEEKNWAKFCGVIESKKEIQRLFQFLAYSFIFNYTKEKNEREYQKIESIIPKLINLNLDKNNIENVKQTYIYYEFENQYKRKGSLDNMINNYSDYVAKLGNNNPFSEKEYNSIVNFFESTFEEPNGDEKYNINNLIMIYIILKDYDLLNTVPNKPIPREAIYYNSKGLGLSAEGFFQRIFDISEILKSRGII